MAKAETDTARMAAQSAVVNFILLTVKVVVDVEVFGNVLLKFD